jgi:hypothetical protein
VVYVICRSCREGAVSTSAGFVASTRELLATVETTARIRDATGADEDLQPDGCVSTPSTREVPPEEHAVPTLDSLRRLVLARDGPRCTIPGCHQSTELFAHHIHWNVTSAAPSSTT